MDESLRLAILNYFRRGQLTRWDQVLSFLSSRFVFKKNARIISAAGKKIKSRDQGGVQKVIAVENYSGRNPVAKKIAEHLQSKANDYLVGAFVHGSIGTSEEIPYSDFDGLVIVKSVCMESPEQLFNLAMVLKETEQMMLEMDPLQHHGWFVMSEADLDDYPEHYFPHVLFGHAKCLMGSNQLHIRARAAGYQREFRMAFQHLSQSIQRKLQSKNFLENYYVFKNLLSEFMLLPAVYIQAKTNDGIFKKFSFEILEQEIGEKYLVMNEISATRQQWNYQAPLQYRDMLEKMSMLAIQRADRSNSGNVPAELKSKFDDDMLRRMNELVNDLKGRIKQ